MMTAADTIAPESRQVRRAEERTEQKIEDRILRVLTRADVAAHVALRITPEMLERAHVRRVDDLEARDKLAMLKRSGDLAGLLYPYVNPITGYDWTYRVRRDHPEMEDGKPKAKYLSSFSDKKRIYFPPGCAALLTDTTIPLIIAEAEKSVLSITCAAEEIGRAVLAIGLGGCWGWKGRIGKATDAKGATVDETGPLTDLDLITWTGRAVEIAFDANAATNTSVQAARRALAKELRGRGAVVRLVDLPVEPNVNGPDDYIGQHGAEAFFTIVDQAGATGAANASVVLNLEDFLAYMPLHSYLFLPSREFWPASSVNARIFPIPNGTNDEGEETTIAANVWLDRHRSVEQMTWAPGLPTIIQDRLVADGGWIDRDGCACVNLYRPPTIAAGDATQAGRWLDLVRTVYPTAANHLIAWLAHRVQRPQDKINHALVLGGVPGIGKDTILEPVKAAIGPWNFAEISPTQLIGRFNGFAKSVILRISEARDLGDMNRYDFYEHMKVYAAAPPDVLRVDEKNIREHAVFNVCGVIITTNHETDGIYLPPDDRRHYVAWSPKTPADFPAGYWTSIYAWYAAGGDRHVAAYLQSYDLSTFNAKAPPAKTETFWAIVDANRTSEDAELADVLEACENPPAVTLKQLIDKCSGTMGDLSLWLKDRRNSRVIPHRMKTADYVPFRNVAAKDGLWKIHNRRQVVYVQQSLPVPERQAAAMELAQLVSPISVVSDRTTTGKVEGYKP